MPSSRDLPDPGIKPWSLALQADSEPPGKANRDGIRELSLQAHVENRTTDEQLKKTELGLNFPSSSPS